MANGYKVSWTRRALNDLNSLIEFLEENWTEKEISQFAENLDHTIELISKNPKIFPASHKKPKIRKAVVDKNNVLYYRYEKQTVELLTLFATKRDPHQRKI